MEDVNGPGTFSFDAELRSDPGRVGQVRDGEFDIRLFDSEYAAEPHEAAVAGGWAQILTAVKRRAEGE